MSSAFLSLTLTLAVLAPPQEGDPIQVVMKNGKSGRIEVISVEGDTVVLKASVMGGTVKVRKKLSEFTPASAFRIQLTATKPESFDAHFGLAKTAADLQLLKQAGDQARAAIGTVAGTPAEAEKTAMLRAWGADTIEGWFNQAVAQDEQRDAQHYLKLLATRLADQRSEEQLAAMAMKLDTMRQEATAKKAAERAAKRDAQTRAAIDRKLGPIHKGVERGDELLRKSIATSRKTSQSARLAEQSINSYRAAWKATAALQEKFPDDQDLATEAGSITEHIHDSAIRAALHAANVLTVQSDYKNAMEWCQKVLKFDPGNSEAKEMVRTIQIAGAAASSNWGWGWGGLPRDLQRPERR